MSPARSPWRPLSAAVAATGLASLCAPLPAAAATAPCERAERWVAEAGAELLHLNRLDLRPAGRDTEPVTDLGVGSARSAMVATAEINSAAVARILGGPATGRSLPLTRTAVQQAPPVEAAAATADTPQATTGPLDLGAGRNTARAGWQPPMACGRATGEVTRAQASLARASVLAGDGGRALVDVPRLRSTSTTTLERRGTDVHMVARAAVTTGTFDLLGGAVRVTVVRQPTLATSISATGAAEVRYVPAVLEVSGDGFETAHLDTAGDEAAIGLGASPAARPESAAGDPLGELLAGLPLDVLNGNHAGTPLVLPGLPARPGVPTIAPRGTESAEAPAPKDSTVRITLGDVRQAVAGHAVAARAAAMRLEIAAAGNPQGYGDSTPAPGGTVLDLDIGVLEAAAVAPEPAGGAPAGTGQGDGVQRDPAGGSGGGLPITGSSVDAIVIGGLSLLVCGLVLLIVGLRGRPFRS